MSHVFRRTSISLWRKRVSHPEPDTVWFLRENEAWAIYFHDLAVRAALQPPYVKAQRQMDCTLQPLAEPFSAQKTFACSAPGVWTGTFPLLNMEVAYGKQHGENSTSNQNTSVFKYSELYRAGIKVKMGKLEVSACRTFLHHGLATLRERFGGLFSMPVCNWSMLLCHP